MYRIYTDAGWHNGKYSWSFIINNDGTIEEKYGVFKNDVDTIQEAEFKAVYMALFYSIHKHKPSNIEMFIDCLHVVQYMQGEGRLRGLFHIQKEIFKLTFINEVSVIYNHVQSHSGVRFNELADANARKALTKYHNGTNKTLFT